VGEVFITNVEPVPVCEATEVALPELVIGPVRFALVVAAGKESGKERGLGFVWKGQL